MADASCQLQTAWVTIIHSSLLLLFFLLKPCSYSRRSKCLGSIIWQVDAYSSWQKCFPWISTNRIQRGKHAFLDGLWGTETRIQQKRHWRKSKTNLWRLHFYPFSKRGILLSLIHSFMLLCTVSSSTCLKLQQHSGRPFPTHNIPLLWSRHLGEEGTHRWGEMVRTAFIGCKEAPPMLPWHADVEFLVWGTNTWLITLSLLNSNFICWTNQSLFSLHSEGGACVSPKAQ